MTEWPPSQRHFEPGRWTVDDLRDGDLVFCARAGGPLAWLGKAADEPWRHVGSLRTNQSGEQVVVETFGERFQHRRLQDFMTAYDSYGAARLDVSDACIRAANDWMSEQIIEGHVYPWDDLLLAGVIAATERGIFRGRRDRVRRALAEAAASCKDRMEHEGTASLTCSAFVQVAYDQVGAGCSIVHDRWRRGSAWPVRVDSVDAFFADPSDEIEMACADATMLDLLALTEVTERHAAGSTMKPDQLGEFLRVIARAVAGYVVPGSPPDAIGSDGRWVTPGDLWRSPSVVVRGMLVP